MGGMNRSLGVPVFPSGKGCYNACFPGQTLEKAMSLLQAEETRTGRVDKFGKGLCPHLLGCRDGRSVSRTEGEIRLGAGAVSANQMYSQQG